MSLTLATFKYPLATPAFIHINKQKFIHMYVYMYILFIPLYNIHMYILYAVVCTWPVINECSTVRPNFNCYKYFFPSFWFPIFYLHLKFLFKKKKT